MRLFNLLCDSYIARLFLSDGNGGWFFAPYRSGELLQAVTDDQREALIALYRRLFVVHLLMEVGVVVLLLASIPGIAIAFSDGVNEAEAGFARDAAIGLAAIFFGLVIALVTYQVTRTKRIVGHRDFLPPRPDRHDIGRKLAAQYAEIWAPYRGATRTAMFVALGLLVVATVLAMTGTAHRGASGGSSAGYLYLYSSAQLAAVYALFKYHRHRRMMKAAL